MLRLSLVLILSAVCLSEGYQDVHTADMDFLHKQKKLFELMFFADQKVLADSEFFEVGRNYDVGTNMEYYTDKSVVREFLFRFKEGKLDYGVLFTPYNLEMVEDMLALYRLFYCAKDFQTFYKTACWARIHVNKYMFVDAFYSAVIYRTDCKFIRLPAPFEIFPHLYFDSRIIHEAHKVKMTHGGFSHTYDVGMKHGVMHSGDTYLIYSNYSGVCMKPYYDPEYKLSYFFEDVGLNSYYYYFRMIFPFWIETKNYDLPKEFRGEFYYYIHKQLMSRYYLERLSNDLGSLRPFDWYEGKFPGFYSNLMYPNGVALPKRDEWFGVPPYKIDYLKKIDLRENRIFEAIDSGIVIDEFGKQYNIYTPEGINILGNLIEGNRDTFNYKYYGSYEILARNFFDYNCEYTCKKWYIPGSLQTFSTSMRDPMFYRIYDKILYYFQRYKENLKQYTQTDLVHSGFKIESYKKIIKAVEGNEPFTYKENLFGFPDRLLLPKGKTEGMQYRFFFYVYPFEEGKLYDIPLIGKWFYDGKPFGFPLDRPVKPWFFTLPNAYFKDVGIFHEKEMTQSY
ncbi:arylphorin subunit alpha-like [Belonocnema kinseyi]|uniref:arylphorin subunit alpha-like n=1 Tax=Belonocnema kinseyi TaxID=2817044 RepID=UPI00143D6AA9|nr:arylphorin subunit alpha-like [Belonocnema kinseyi]